ncbi:MAG: YhcH/YjgK/YiaL family protein [Verrucomicrobia bacterium]|nr:YhcH/YjgK/YiaL family protein [Verrucomicrobiota bacterium]
MILDTLGNASTYEKLHSSFSRAFAWLASYDPATPDGRYTIGDDSLIAIVQRYDTAPAESKKWETHRVHGDIQYLVEGAERIGYAERDILAVKTPYNPEKDAEFYQAPTCSSTLLELNAGSFAIFLPRDGHQPGVMIDSPALVQKVVIKFRL